MKTAIYGALLAGIVAAIAGAYLHGRSVEGSEREAELLNERLAYAEAFRAGTEQNDKLKAEGARQHAKDTASTERVRADFAAFRLRMPKAKNCDDVPNSASRGLDGGSGSGIRPDPEQAAFDRFTDGTKQDDYKIDSVLDSCRVVMSWARNLCKFNNNCEGMADASRE